MDIVIEGLHGFGDNIYQRSALKKATRPVWLRTPWPQLYTDMPLVRPIRANSKLRTQAVNERASPAGSYRALEEGVEYRTRKVYYSPKELAQRSVPAAISACLGVEEGPLDLPPLPGHGIIFSRPYAVVRPVTVRTEWRNEARNPSALHVYEVAAALKAAGYFVVSIAHVDPPYEILDGPTPPADLQFLTGQLSTMQALALVAGASVVAGGVGWIVPAAFAAGVPLIGVLGGQGGHNAPEVVTPKAHANHKALWLYPENFCRCADMLHRCDKRIEDVDGKTAAWLAGLRQDKAA